MGTITSSGVGSGIDIEGLVGRLVQAEGAPRQARLVRDEALLQGRLSAFGSFRSALDQLRAALAGLKSGTGFQARAVTSGDPKLFAATAGATAPTGRWDLEIERLATAPKLASGPQANASTLVGTGTLTISVGARSFSVTLDETTGTLAGLRAAIANAGAEAGVSATLITANDGVRLVLAGTATGAANAVRVSASGGDGGLAALEFDPVTATGGLVQLQAAGDARVRIDGFVVDSPRNLLEGAIEGVTLNLLQPTAPGTSTTLTVANDEAAPQALVNGFVTAYNRLLTSLRPLGAYDAQTRQGGALLGDPTLRDFLSGLRRQVGAPAGAAAEGALRSLAEIGITTELDGTLKVDATRLGTALRERGTAVAALFAGEGGLAGRLDGLLGQYLQAGGLIDARTNGLRESIKDVGKQREALAQRLGAMESRLRSQFTAMDTLVAQLRQTGSNLNAALAALQPLGQQR